MKSLKPGHHIAKILLFRTHHLWTSTTELILILKIVGFLDYISEFFLNGKLWYESTFVSKIGVLGFRRNMRKPFFHCLPNMLFEFFAIAIENLMEFSPNKHQINIVPSINKRNWICPSCLINLWLEEPVKCKSHTPYGKVRATGILLFLKIDK